ncbi:MAG TPA: AraC family transcriptional regulator ligand-binding domain-containing protein, partial [Patescibacteria group bacterium]|nr:AraC family transcriptional regulator ligand-binding domain-containing protein [Patescibacteria group bacterium]
EQPTLRLALDAMVAFGRRLNDALHLTVEESSDVVVLREEVVVGHGGPVRQSTELAIGVAFRTLRQIMGPEWRPRRVCFAHDAPSDRSVHERVFGRNVEFEHDFNGIVCSRDDLARANPQADPEAARLAKRLVDASPGLTATDTTSARVRKVVVMQLATGCTIDSVAGQLGVARRTIHRRLAQEGETFSAILDAVRKEFAERYLRDGNRKLTEVSGLLGFSALSGFSRWYRRQHGGRASKARKHSRAHTNSSKRPHE